MAEGFPHGSLRSAGQFRPNSIEFPIVAIPAPEWPACRPCLRQK